MCPDRYIPHIQLYIYTCALTGIYHIYSYIYIYMCPDSPAPLYSMWTDGSGNEHTHFAPDSGLEGEHCCVKVVLGTAL